MPITSDNQSRQTVSRALGLLAWCALLTGATSARVDQNQPPGAAAAAPKENISDATDRLNKGGAFPADITLIAKIRGAQAVPDLKKHFELAPDDDIFHDYTLKGSIASALVRLGDKDPAPWDYLVKGAGDAITSDAPSPARFDANGKLIPGPSPEFIAWAKAHKLTTDSALETQMTKLPAMVVFLGDTGDRRAIPLLRQALTSSNFMVQATAAQGLAQLQDKASIPLIIEACQQAPADAALVIARSLVDFDDPQAQAAAKVFRPSANGH